MNTMLKPAVALAILGVAVSSVSACASQGTKPSAAASGTSAGGGAPASTATATTRTAAPNASGTTAASTAVAGATTADGGAATPMCGNAKLTVKLTKPAKARPSVYLINVTNTGPMCRMQYLPYVVIEKSATDPGSDIKPLIPSGLGGGPLVIGAGRTLYAAIELDPEARGVPGYRALAVTANPTRDVSGKDVQDVALPGASAKVGKPKLGLYSDSARTAVGLQDGADASE